MKYYLPSLSFLLLFVFCSQSQVFAQDTNEVFYLDTQDSFYSEYGLWENSSNLENYGKSGSRMAPSAAFYNKARYDFDSIPRKEYQLSAWWAGHPENAKKVAYVIHHGEQTDRILVNQSKASNPGAWNVLGNFVLGPQDYVEIIGTGNQGNIITDAIRLVSTTNSPVVPVRADFRIAVLGNLFSEEAKTYPWQIDSIFNRLPKIWDPDLVLIAGEVIPEKGSGDSLSIRQNWKNFNDVVIQPLRKNEIPIAFMGDNYSKMVLTAGGSASDSLSETPTIYNSGLNFVDKAQYPKYYTFKQNNVFFVALGDFPPKDPTKILSWLEQQLKTQTAKNSDYRMILGNFRLYPQKIKDSLTKNTLSKYKKLFQEYGVDTYISGARDSYFPGKRNQMDVLRAGGPEVMTLLDVFDAKNAIVYSTYKIQEKDAQKMKLLVNEDFPSALRDSTGILLRRDIELSQKASGAFSAFNTITTTNESGKGSVTAEIRGNHLLVSGHYFNLDGSLKDSTSIGLFKGQNAERGQLLTVLQPKSQNGGLGMFSGSYELQPQTQKLLSIGGLYTTIETDKGVLRTQLYPEENVAPLAAEISSHNNRNVYAVRDLDTIYKINWKSSTDPDGDLVSYVYQLSTDQHFNNIIFEKHTGTASFLKQPEKTLFSLLGNAKIGHPVIFYQRVAATDGKNIRFSPGKKLKLMKGYASLEETKSTEEPKIKAAPGGEFGASWD